MILDHFSYVLVTIFDEKIIAPWEHLTNAMTFDAIRPGYDGFIPMTISVA